MHFDVQMAAWRIAYVANRHKAIAHIVRSYGAFM
jgi:hypothetical protein